jgi:DNA-binding PucR family transcriptional regulator
MEARVEHLRSAAAQRAWERVLCPLAAATTEQAHELSVTLVERTRAETPELFDDPESAETNRASTEASLRAVAAIIEQGADPQDIELPPQTVAYARAAVQRGVPLTALLRTYRLQHAVLWDILLPLIAERAEDRCELAEATALASAIMFAYVDEALVLAEQAYSAERERWARSAAATQADTIDAILAGRPVDARQASRRLRYELEREHVGVFAWLEAAPEDADPAAALEAAVAQVAVAASAASTLVRPLGLLATSAWLSAAAPDALDDARLDIAAAPGVRVALGEPGSGAAGFRRTHEQAVHARRVATLAGRSPGSVTRYGRVALAALATADADQAAAFVRDELGKLAADDDTSRRLAATVRVYLDEHCSRSRAAKRLGLHENTISYRVRQAEEILGRSVEQDTLDLHVALALAGVVG